MRILLGGARLGTRPLRRAVWGFTVAAISFIAWIVATSRSWPREDPFPSVSPALVVALSSSVKRDWLLDPAGEGRLRAAAAIASRLNSPRLVTTRVYDGKSGLTSDYGQRSVITTTEYSGQWTIVGPIVRSTHDEAVALRAAVAGRPTIVVVTSRMHTRRACATFEQVGFIVTCVGYIDPRWWRTPVAYLYERAAVIKYRRKGWVR